MCQDANVELAWLPPYLSNFNPIETLFAVLKAWIKKHRDLISCYTEEKREFRQFLIDAVKSQGATGDPGALF